jgi:hypothetical protein
MNRQWKNISSIDRFYPLAVTAKHHDYESLKRLWYIHGR